MEVSPETASWAADEFIDYFSHMGNIEDYMRFVKMQVISGTSRLFSLKDEFLNEDIHPEDMDFEIVRVGSNKYTGGPGRVSQETFNDLLASVSSQKIDSSPHERSESSTGEQAVCHQDSCIQMVAMVQSQIPSLHGD